MPSTLRRSTGLIIATVGLLAAIPRTLAQSYTVTPLGALTAGDTVSPAAINAAGQVVGTEQLAGGSGQTAVSYANGVLTPLGSLGGSSTNAWGINDSGVVVGAGTTADGIQQAFAYSQGQMTTLGTLGGTYSCAYAVNASGTIVGASSTGGGQQDPFSYSAGVMTDLGSLGAGGWASAINASGQIVGTVGNPATGELTAFLYAGGTLQNLGTLDGVASEATGINASGQVVGFAVTADNHFEAFLYAGGAMQKLGSLGGTWSQAWAINDAGTIVGTSTKAAGNPVAFVYRSGALTDLNTLVGMTGNVTLTNAVAINDAGQIVASGSDQQAYLLTPASNPAAPATGASSPTPTPTPSPAPTATPTAPPAPASSPPATATPVPTPTPGPSATPVAQSGSTALHLTNVSTRAYVGTQGNVAIAGFVVAGDAGATSVLIRAIGPALTQFAVTGVLAQPVLTVFDSAGNAIGSNTAWGTSPNVAQLTAAMVAAGAFALPAGSADSALLLSLKPGSYTAQVAGLNSSTGTALIEVYELPATP